MSGHPRMTTEQIGGMDDVLVHVENERHRQHAKWGEQNHRDGTGPRVYVLKDVNLDMRTGAELAQAFTNKTNQRAQAGVVTYRDILLEEVFEALAEDDPAKLRGELVQAAAVLVAWIEKLDREKAARS